MTRTESFILPSFWYQAVVNADYRLLDEAEFSRFLAWSRQTDDLEFVRVKDAPFGMDDCLSFTFREVM